MTDLRNTGEQTFVSPLSAEDMPSHTSSAKNKPARKPKRKSAPKTFADAYDILKTNAEVLQNSTEPDIDNLMSVVEESIVAYKVCQTRIEAVETALKEAFTQTELTTTDPLD